MGCCGDEDSEEAEEKHFDGPLKERSCRDVLFIFIFLGLLAGMGYVVFLALQLGDPYRLINGIDSWGNICNKKNNVINGAMYSGKDLRGLSKLFYFNFKLDAFLGFSSLTRTTAVCTKRCPEQQLMTASDVARFAHTTGSNLCFYDVNILAAYQAEVSRQRCPNLPISAHREFLNRCIPTENLQGPSFTSLDRISKVFTNDFFKNIIHDIETAWLEIVYLGLVSLACSLFLVLLLWLLAGVLIWLVYILGILGTMAVTAYIWYRFYLEKTNYDNIHESLRTSRIKEKYYAWLGGGVAASVVTLAVLLILLVMRKRIALVIALFKEAGKAVWKMPLLLFQPIWTLIFLAGTCAGAIFIYFYIATGGHPKIDYMTSRVYYEEDKVLSGLKWYLLFGTLWILQFLFACQHIVVAGSIAKYFFTRDKKELGWPIIDATCRLIRYHLGSAIFGSAIIALMQFIRAILAFIQSKVKDESNACASFCLKCMACCLYCFEKFLKFLNKNAYIEIAIYGYSFCKAAQEAFAIIMTNALRMFAINSVGNFMLFLGKILVVAATAVVGMFLLQNKPNLNYIWLPIVLACIFAYMIANCFLSIYEMAVDTLFICFCEDCKRNDGVTKPYFMSKSLMKFVKKSSSTSKETSPSKEKSSPS